MAAEALREIVARLGVEIDDTQLKTLDGSLNKVIKKMGNMIKTAALVTAGAAAFSFLNDQVKEGVKISQWADRLGFTNKELQMFRYAAEQGGASADNFNLAMKLLGKHVGDAAEGQKASTKMFAQYGIQIRDANGELNSMPNVLIQVADRMSKMDNAGERLAFAMHTMGKGGASLIPMLMQGGDAVKALFEDFQKMGGGMSDEFIAACKKANAALIRMRTATQVWHSEIALGALPALTWLGNKMAQSAAANVAWARRTTFAQTAWIAFAAVLLASAAPILSVLWSFLVPLVPWIALGLAAYLIFDDLFALFTGQGSLIGRVLDNVLGKGASTEFVDSLKRSWDAVEQSVKNVGEAFKMSEGSGRSMIETITIEIAKLIKVLAGALQVVAGVTEGAFYAVKAVGGALTATDEKQAEQAKADWARSGQALYNIGSVTDQGGAWDFSMFGGTKDQQNRLRAGGGGVEFTPEAAAAIANPANYGTGTRFNDAGQPIKVEVNTTIQGNASEGTVRKMSGFVRDGVQQALDEAAAAKGTR